MWLKLLKPWQSKPAGEKLDTTPEQADVLIKAGYAEKVDDDPLQATITTAIGDATQKISAGMSSAIDAALKQFASAAGLSRRNGDPLLFGPTPSNRDDTFGKFLLAVRNHDRKALDRFGSHWVDHHGETKAVDLEGGQGDLGGYLVPDQFIASILSHASEAAIVRPRATDVPMRARQVDWPALDVSTAPSTGHSAMFGGLQAFWTAEGQSKTQTEPTFNSIRLTANELAGYTVASNALMDDSGVGLEQLLRQLFGRAIAWYEDYHFLRGTGAGQPLGILNATCLKTVSKTGSQAAATLSLQNLADMLASFLPGHNPRSTVWVGNQTILKQLIPLVSSSTGGGLIWMPGQQIIGAPPMQLLGFPLLMSEKLPVLGTVGDIILCDFSHYLAGRKTTSSGADQLEIAFSEHVKFLTNQGTWRFCKRFDGQPWMRDKITLADGNTTVSPFIALETRD